MEISLPVPAGTRLPLPEGTGVPLVCRLCRCRFDVAVGASREEVRCPRCQARIPSDLVERAHEATGNEETPRVGCPRCLRLLRPSGGSPYTCSYCGTFIHAEEGQRLARLLDGLGARVRRALLEGHPPGEQVRSIVSLGIDEERASAYVDLRVSELPFERHVAWKQGKPVRPAACCDACGRAAALQPFEVEWNARPEELQRYRTGWGGFEGEFSRATSYIRHALYYLCDPCRRVLRRPEFAGGYPARFGFRVRWSRRIEEP